MSAITGLGTTYNLPNYAGELILVTPTETPFLTAIGGLTSRAADAVVTATEFTWQTEDLEGPSQPAILEGADPVYTERTRLLVSNVCQIFQQGVTLSYTKMAAINQLAMNGNGEAQPVDNEMDHQITLRLKAIARNIEYSFLNGVYQKPSDNTTARKTRGLLASIATNVVTNGTPTALTRAMVNSLLKAVFDSRGIHGELEPTLMVNSFQKQQLSAIYLVNGRLETSRDVGGVSVTQIVSDFGPINVMVNRYMPADQVAFTHLGACKPKFLLIPNKGFLFMEPLSQSGAAVKAQIYGEIGLQYGDEGLHGLISGLTTS